MRQAIGEANYIDSAVKDYVYSQPCLEVWMTVRSMLFEDEYNILNSDGDLTVLETDWQKIGTRWERLLFHGFPNPEGGCQVEALRAWTLELDGSKPLVQRAWKLEWRLVRALDPEAARQIQKHAYTAGQNARHKRAN